MDKTSGLFRTIDDFCWNSCLIHYYVNIYITTGFTYAFAHKSFTISGDIMIEVYPDRLEISNPGGLPLGVTKDNILHARQRRNPQLIRIMHDLKLMEGEGSGYDLIYELNAMDSKQNPEIISDFNHTKVVQSAAITDIEILPLLDYVVQNYQLSQKDFIAFGLVAQHKKLLSTQLTNLLQLAEEDRLRSYTVGLLRQEILITQGVGKGNAFFINPKLIQCSKANLKTSLKTIEPYRLKALIQEDLRIYPNSLISEIHNRLPDLDKEELQRYVYDMVKAGIITQNGGKAYRRYIINEAWQKKKESKKKIQKIRINKQKEHTILPIRIASQSVTLIHTIPQTIFLTSRKWFVSLQAIQRPPL